jgi:hypothetical protein
MKKYVLILAAFFTAGISGCKKDYLSLETNPNTPSATTPQLTLSAALNATASNVVGQYNYYGVWAGYWTTSGNYVPNSTINQYQFTPTSFQGDWTAWYANLTNYNALQVLASKDPKLADYQAIAMVMKAYGFQILVDQYNDVPYTQAFQPSTIVFPAYDKGVDIYHDLGKQLDAAIALMGKAGAVAPGSDDIVYQGDMSKWTKFANTLKLKLAMRVFTKTPADDLVAAAKATEGLGYIDEGSAAIVNPGYSNQTGKQNPFYANYGAGPDGNPSANNVYFRANAFAVNFLNNNNDPRATRLYALNTPGVIRGNIFGDPNVQTNTFTSAIGPGLNQSASQGQPILGAPESLFLQAEAVNNGIFAASSSGLSDGSIANGAAAGSAQALYEGGITASFEDLGVGSTKTLSDAAALAYFTQTTNNIGWTSSGNKEAAIITQKWIALDGYFNFEGYNEYRRTGFPALPSSIDPAAISPTLPTRIPYPQSELSTNAGNLSKEGTLNYFSSKIFWAK